MCSFSTAEELIKKCDELSCEEEALQSELEALLQFDDHLEYSLKRINKKMPDVEYLLSDSSQLSDRINFTSALSQNVSFKVRKLDLAKSRVTQCLQRVGDILDLKYCVDGIHKSLFNEDYEQGAAYIHRFLSIDVSVLRNSSDDEIYATENENSGMLSSSSMDEAFSKFYEAKNKLQEIVRNKFDEAVKHNDVASTERFFKIFPLLNEAAEGLNKFSNYLSQKVEEQGMKRVSELATHVLQLTALFESVAKTIDIHQPLVETYYGHGNLIFVIEILQKQCDRSSKRIIEDFKLTKDFVQIVTSVTKSMKSGSSSNSNKINPREIDELLSELMMITSRATKYFLFICERTRKDVELAFVEGSDEREKRLQQLNETVRTCELSRAVEEINGMYVLLEEYFLRESCFKAVQIDDIDSQGSLTSSMLDDVFFIVNKCIKRSMTGGNIDVVCAIINHSVSILEKSFCDLANERLRYGYPSTATITGAAAALDLSQAYSVIQTGRYLQSYSDVERTKVLFLIALNNLDTATDYIKSLKKTVNQDVIKIVEDKSGRQQLQKFESCLADLSSLTNKFQSVVLSGLNQLNSSVLKPKVKVWCDSFMTASHVLNEDDLLRFEVSDGLRPFSETFIMSIDVFLKPFKQSLTPNNCTKLINVFATDLAHRLEVAISRCHYNKIGGLQLDRELRALIGYITSLTTWSLRDKFNRLRDIALVLSADTVSEVIEFFKEEKLDSPSRLSAHEIPSFLRQRVEFSEEDIRKIFIKHDSEKRFV
ncbi:Conserved oligomeric Golgi complex subunit 4-like protein [Leptotrombidium deliense]|uniref:Conserved oligomeric Golgi complex subunit 4 n=1 Tax=Leptotrombidium deliense TaxID=299467 RepID=A0A443SR21_9ACAR|nr:Conserved oligomeric Golgi complex subunit 4-like protein [Leptotrombidium deliense]